VRPVKCKVQITVFVAIDGLVISRRCVAGELYVSVECQELFQYQIQLSCIRKIKLKNGEG